MPRAHHCCFGSDLVGLGRGIALGDPRRARRRLLDLPHSGWRLGRNQLHVIDQVDLSNPKLASVMTGPYLPNPPSQFTLNQPRAGAAWQAALAIESGLGPKNVAMSSRRSWLSIPADSQRR